MIYLDYAASTPVDPDVLDNFINVTKEEIDKLSKIFDKCYKELI